MKPKHFAVLVLVSLYASYCVVEEKCWGSSCADPITFQLIDKLSQQDLVFGLNPKYKLDSMQLNRQPDFNFGYHSNHLSDITGNNHGLQASIGKPAVDTTYLRLSYNDIDTIIINFARESKECCNEFGGYGKIISIKYNGETAIKNGINYLFKKE